MTCTALFANGTPAIAGALQAVDCMAGEATATAFGRIFGGDGLLTGALTIGLTLYVALFAIGLLTGRAGLNLGALTPRMMALGLALTFATSWVAYSQVVWNLLSLGPDWIASTVLGIKGSATHAFAERLDVLFQAVADAAEQARPDADQAKGGGTTPGDLLTYAALLLLLGTVGVLVTSRIALAALLAVGPIFVILSLFAGTRGLFEGWVKAAVTFALVPLFTVLIGVGAVAMLTPVIAQLAGGAVDISQAATVFVAAAVHCALMAMSLKLVTTLTSGWRLPFTGAAAVQREPGPAAMGATATAARMSTVVAGTASHAGQTPRDDRVRSVVAAVTMPSATSITSAAPMRLPGAVVTLPPPLAPASTPRAREIGRGMRTAPSTASSQEILA